MCGSGKFGSGEFGSVEFGSQEFGTVVESLVVKSLVVETLVNHRYVRCLPLLYIGRKDHFMSKHKLVWSKTSTSICCSMQGHCYGMEILIPIAYIILIMASYHLQDCEILAFYLPVAYMNNRVLCMF